jgi:hypothetical protein
MVLIVSPSFDYPAPASGEQRSSSSSRKRAVLARRSAGIQHENRPKDANILCLRRFSLWIPGAASAEEAVADRG